MVLPLAQARFALGATNFFIKISMLASVVCLMQGGSCHSWLAAG
jgi:hypothetical protein